MILTKEEKAKIIKKFGTDEKNTGNTQAQIAMFTERINHLTEHLKSNKNDMSTQRALVNLVGKRKSLLDYLKAKDITLYRKILVDLNIRK
ncbi:MAG TPA: 30S ribosomal protein S15 [Flavobacteriales bacterium]|nr:30S ribosomal protein S15 [Flavobacteriales bacterium]